MVEPQDSLNQPIRVVLFGGGPVLERGVKQFLHRLEAHPKIAFLGAFCQSPGQTFWDVMRDLWQRRRFLAVPLLAVQTAGMVGRSLLHPRDEMALNKSVARLANRIHYVPDIHAREVLERVQSLAPDLGLIYSSPILKPELFEIPKFGTLGIHHGKVPEYRGKKTMFWAIYNGEEVAGVTIQKVNAGLDTGEIVKEGAVLIGRRWPWVIWKELEMLGLDLYTQAILEIKQGTVSYRPQIGQKGPLYRDPKLGDILTFWRRYLRKYLG